MTIPVRYSLIFLLAYYAPMLIGCGGSGGDAKDEPEEAPRPPSISNITCGDTTNNEPIAVEVPEEEVPAVIDTILLEGGQAEVVEDDDIGTGSLGQEVRQGFKTVLIAGCGSEVNIDNSVTTVTTIGDGDK